MKYIKFLIIVGILALCNFQASATHIVGGEMTYRCLGNDKYEIVLTVYRDCFYGDPAAFFDDPAWLAFYKGKDNTPANVGIDGVVYVPYNPLDTLDGKITTECKVLGQDVCVHRGVYRTIVTLPAIEGGYNIVYQRCCRNVTLENIIDPLETGAIFTVFISETALRSCNSSPTIDEWPPIYICANKPLNYDHSATDIDGDTLLYRLCTPLADGSTKDGRIFPPPAPPFDTVVWKSPYNLQNLLGGTDPLKIDYQTGILTGTPPTIGQFLVGVCVDEFRNGKLLSRIRRDFQYNVRECINETTACFNIPDTLCNTKEVEFNNCSVGAEQYFWTFENGTPDTSTAENPKVTFPAFGSYHVRLIAKLDAKCIDTLDKVIVLTTATIQSNFSLKVPECDNLAKISTTNLSVGAANYRWYVDGGSVHETSTDFQPSFDVPTGTYNVTLIAWHLNGCSDTTSKTITVRSLNQEVIPKEYTVCSDTTFIMNPNGSADLVYSWNPTIYLSNPNIPNPTVVNPQNSTTYFVNILDPVSGCSYLDTIEVKVLPIPTLGFGWENACGTLKVDFTNNSTGATNFVWDFGDGNTSTDQNPSHTYAQPGNYTVTIRNEGGCTRTFQEDVAVDFINIDAVNDSFFLCDTKTIHLNPNPDTSYEYIWSPANLLDDPNSPNPLATVDKYTVFTVRVSHKAFRDCYVEGRVAVDIAQISADANGGNLICEQSNTDLHVIINSNAQNPTIVWSPDYNIISGQGTNTLTVFAERDTTYHVKVDFGNGCSIEKDVPVNVSNFGGQIIVTATPDTIFDVQKIQLNAFPAGLKYRWSPTEGLSDPNISNPIYTPTGPGPYDVNFTVQVTNADNCVLSGTISIHVRETQCNDKHIFLPNAFSPNGKGDPRNEVLRLFNNGVVNKLNRFIVYNRLGQEVFNTTDINFVWDGKFKGKELDPDVYGYYLDVECIGGQEYKIKGNITIIK
jgi:gliding motility-associated-like protein